MAVFLLPQPARADDPRAAGGMLGWTHDDMARALGIFVPERMKTLEVPGVSLAVVADGVIVYSGTFGKADKGVSTPVTPATLFEAGELGETVAAYGAMGMVRDKLLFLDAPLSRDLPSPWLVNGDDDARVTLRTVLTHRSGLGDNVAHPSRATSFDPGSRFSHSGVGFLYLQHVMESIAGAPFDELMRKRVLAPLDMRSSGYTLPAGARAQLAQGYVPLRFPLAVFYLPFAVAFALIFSTMWGISRFILQRRIEPVDLAWPVFGGFGFAVAIVWWGLGLAPAAFVVGIAITCALVVAMLAGFAYYLLYIAGLAKAREGIISRGRGSREGMIVVLAGAIALGGFLPALNWLVPVARFTVLRGEERANAAMSFHTTAQDMARFMIETMDGAKLGSEMRNRMLGEQAPVEGPFFWSLGPGVRQDGARQTLWTRGTAMGFESLMVMDPSRRAGVVVLTNSREGGELAQDVARNVLGVEAVWSLP
ncbi:MAG: beta-lactamase family protein [Parvibaculum sp.]|uniref:serine hydrolase domain-containing protein n=1 Tax=Parvibaculum sp. TaxID=2024848 RepID=UPI0025CCFCFF|nr:serine hydrolase domain-containing protein [Parvibaculum sp.]MCE9648320.1 beta-lactamase family protein [Parvibaculum sp.]